MKWGGQIRIAGSTTFDNHIVMLFGVYVRSGLGAGRPGHCTVMMVVFLVYLTGTFNWLRSLNVNKSK